MKPFSIIFGLKSVIRRKQKNFFGILAIALGVSLITGISITDQSLSTGFGIFFTYSLGDVDGSVTYPNNFLNESLANNIGTNLVSLENVTAYTTELSIPVTTSTDEGQISTGSVLKGITDDPNTFGHLVVDKNQYVNVSDLGLNEVYMGKVLADDLRISAGENFTYSLSYGPAHVEQEFTVKSIVVNEQRSAMSNNNGIFLRLSDLQSDLSSFFHQLGFNLNKPVNMILLKFSSAISTPDDASNLVTQMKDKVESNVPEISLLGGIRTLTFSTDRVTIKDYGKSLADSLGNLLTIFGSILIIAGLILIVNIQLMTIENKEKQIGIQRAVGTKNYQIISSNLTEFVIIGLVGGLIGIFGGILFGWILIYAFGISFGFDGSLIPLTVPSSITITAFIMGFSISILAGLYPAIKASSINVIEVLRGIQIKEFKVNKGTGLWGFATGILLTVLGLLSVMGLSKSPLDFPDAYKNVGDAESIYVATTFLLVGILVLLSYFVSRNMILTITGFALMIYPIVQMTVVFDQIKEGSGGVTMILVMTVSLVGGAILLVSLNLDKIANFSEWIFSFFFSAVSLISFRQMASQKTRSTLTFTIFAFILTLNIFLASWSYSDRFGAEHRVQVLSGGSDELIISSLPLPSDVANNYTNGLETKFPAITHASSFPHSGPTELYLNDNGTINPDKNATNIFGVDIFSISSDAMIHNNDVTFNFVLSNQKLNTSKYTFPASYTNGLETDNNTSDIDRYTDSNVQEDANVWKFFSSGLSVINKTSGKEVPVIITSLLATINLGTQQINYLKHVSDSVWLPLKNGSFQEFVIIAISSDNPLFNSIVLNQQAGVPTITAGAFIQEKWARQLAVFNPTPTFSKVDQANYFLASTNYASVKSDENKVLAQDIESWSNSKDPNSFRTQENHIYGFIGISVYSLYEATFDGQFRVFQFMQYFTTLGFLFGIISLLVVSVRSVQERKREIGMMRSIGIKRSEVVIALILELSVMGVIGLLIGLLNGNLLAYGLVRINSGGFTEFLIPWDTIFIYTLLTVGSALFASIIPGRVASMIPPSDALRYTG